MPGIYRNMAECYCKPIKKECSPEPQKEGSERTTLNQIDDEDDCTTRWRPVGCRTP